MNNPISVSVLNAQIKSLLETTFIQVYVQGEISNLTYHNSGHIYFSIKDESSTLSCVMFRGNAKYLRFTLEVGMKIEIWGNITVYAPRGNYQLLCNKIEPSGKGSLALAFEQLKEKLEKKGYFNPHIKKTLPKYPKKIAIVTSSTGAAIEDMKKVASHRWAMLELVLIPTLVQGEGASSDIASSIKYADSLNCDIMIVGRGGGSIEDLWAFNEEIVADAIFKAITPIISAVGHEVDYLISDFVADIRAATPSNAMEIALPDINEHKMYLDNIYNTYENKFKNIILHKQQELSNIKELFDKNSIENKISYKNSELKILKDMLKNTFIQKIHNKQKEIELLKQGFNLNNPEQKDKKGFVQISKDNKTISLEKVKVKDTISLQTSKYIALCTINEINKQ